MNWLIVKKGHKWIITAMLDAKPSKDVNVKDVKFTMFDHTEDKVYEYCRLLLLGHETPLLYVM